MRQFYYAREGESHGPIGPAEFRALGLAPDTLIWHEEFPDWLPAAQVPELRAALPGAPPSPRPAPREAPHQPHFGGIPSGEWPRDVATTETRPASRPAKTPKTPKSDSPTKAERRAQRERDIVAPPPAKRAKGGAWRFYLLILLGWYVWSRFANQREAATPVVDHATPADSAAPAPVAAPVATTEWEQEAAEPARYLKPEYTVPQDLAGEVTLRGTLRSEARAATYLGIILQVACFNDTGNLLVKEWRQVDGAVAPGAAVPFQIQVKPLPGTQTVQVEVLRAEAAPAAGQ